jgi:hypothetical protein
VLSKVEIIGESVEFIYCACGCKKTRPKYDKRGRLRYFISRHETRNRSEESKRKLSESKKGHIVTEETRRKISISLTGLTGEKSRNWKSDNVGIGALHEWVRRYYPNKPELCEICHKIPPKDLANITGIYKRDFKNWGWFCYHCHRKFDNIDERIKISRRSKKRMSN